MCRKRGFNDLSIARLAQQGERAAEDRYAKGSSPLSSTYLRVTQLGRVVGCRPTCRGFKSLPLDSPLIICEVRFLVGSNHFKN